MSTLDNFTVFECPGIKDKFEAWINPYLFEETQVIRSVHDKVPRFGRSSNITPVLLDGLETDEGVSYVQGLFAASLVISIVILGWFVLLAVFACCGPKRVGLLSGRLLALPSSNNNSNSNTKGYHDPNDDKIHLPPAQVYEHNNNNNNNNSNGVTSSKSELRQRRTLKFVRCFVLFCSLSIFICCIIMITKGIQSLVESQQNTVKGINKARELADEGVQLIDLLLNLTNSSSTSSNEMAMALNTNYCPLVRSELCTNLTAYLDSPAAEQAGTDVQTLDDICNFEDIPYADQVKDLMDSDTPEWISESLLSTRQDCVEFSEKMADMEANSGDYNWAFAVAASFAAVLSVLCLVISYGVVEAWFGCTKNRNCLLRLFKCLRHWLLLPMFILFVIICWVFSMVFIIGSTASADLCYNNPDDRMSAVLIKYGGFHGKVPSVNSTGSIDFANVDSDSIMLLFLLYILQGCPADGSSPQELIESITHVLAVLDKTVDLIVDVVNDVDLTAVCGSDPVDLLTGNTTTVFENRVCSIGEALVALEAYFSCQNWRPLYTIVMYEAVCYQANDGFYYVSITQFLIVIFAMIMLTCRVAFTEMDFDQDEDGNDNRALEGLDNAATVMAASAPPQDDVARTEAPRDEHEQKNDLVMASQLATGSFSQHSDDALDNAATVMAVSAPPQEDVARTEAPRDEYEQKNDLLMASPLATGSASQHSDDAIYATVN